MDQQRVLFEHNPAFILACIGIGLAYAYILYRSKHTWSKRSNNILFVIRAVLVSFLAFLLIGPILKLTINEFEKPSLVFVIDNSTSVGDVIDSTEWIKINSDIETSAKALQQFGYEVKLRTLGGDYVAPITFTKSTSDLNGALQRTLEEYEGKNLAGVVVVSDGIYNTGNSPLYTASRVPIYTIGVGDTTERVDLNLRNILYNKIAYQGNQFPLRVEVLAKGIQDQEVKISVYQKGKLVARDQKQIGNKALIDFDFQIQASEKGLQRLDVSVEPLGQEKNTKNNYSSIFIEVVEGKKKILFIAPGPHPDIKALRSVVEKNTNYEFILHIPGVKEATAEQMNAANLDLVVFQQAFDYTGKTQVLIKNYMERGTSLFLMLGQRSNLRQLAANEIPLSFENPGQWDAVTPLVNVDFSAFGFSDDLNSTLSRYPPVSVPFGKFSYPGSANILFYQRIGSVSTDRPMLFTLDDDGSKMAIMLAEGIWQWRLDEYSETQDTKAFDEVFSKLIQYLSTREDRRRFRSFPLQSEFTASEPVVIESQVYNELFEQVFGNKIELTLTDENNKTSEYSYVTGPGNSKYRIGGLAEGVYKYTASTEVSGKRELVSGEFLVTVQNIESQNLTADFNMLSKWAANTGGAFYGTEEIEQLNQRLELAEATSLIRSEESFNPLINIKLVFVLLLLLVSAEWFLRKYLGSY